ncbi:MAG: T9SS type A sorting domain-containing protein [Bacteroidales bacterium]|nr:T9SS type A sorting domain-containing protein [Bacteroidales bacterium]MCF8333463.1 T9SS type A sorting domain-containing protein [Bacteroidales bacterium]
MNLLKSFFLTCLTIFLFNSVFSQNWQWEWGVTTTLTSTSTSNHLEDTDFQNNVYIKTQYGDSVFFGDTSFIHHEYGYDGWVNWALVKYNERGELLNAMDIMALPGEVIYDLEAASDSQENLYVSTDFQSQVTIKDSTIYPAESSPEVGLDVTLAKFNSFFEMEWHHLISSKTLDRVVEIIVSPEDYIYVLTHHQGGGPGGVDTVNILNQDTVIISSLMNSLAKIDPQGNLVWQHSLPNLSIPENLFIHGENNNLTLTGRTYHDLVYRQDTIGHPQPEETRPYILEIDSAGNFLSGAIPDWHMVFTDTERDVYGNFYFSSKPWGQMVIDNDTITPDEYSDLRLLVKLNTDYEPVWYHTAESLQGDVAPHFDLATYEDTLFFAANGQKDFAVFDTIFDTDYYPEAFVGKIGPQGNLDYFTFSECSWSFDPNNIRLDNCNNLLVSGSYWGELYLQNDTLQSHSVNISDGVLTKINRGGASDFSLGPDTLVCDSIVLEAPQDMAYYYWNDTLSENNWINVQESGMYTLEYATESGCWNRDTLFVEVQQGFSIDLGKDTTIAPRDTLILSVADTLDSYLWSDGSTGDSLIIPGDSVDEDGLNVWVNATQGVCTSADTLYIESSASIPELTEIGVTLYPNPVKERLFIKTSKRVKKIELLNTRGRLIWEKRYPNSKNNPVKLDMSPYSKGIYFINVKLENEAGVGKVIKL